MTVAEQRPQVKYDGGRLLVDNTIANLKTVLVAEEGVSGSGFAKWSKFFP